MFILWLDVMCKMIEHYLHNVYLKYTLALDLLLCNQYLLQILFDLQIRIRNNNFLHLMIAGELLLGARGNHCCAAIVTS